MHARSGPAVLVGGDTAWPTSLPDPVRVASADSDLLESASVAVLVCGLGGWALLDGWRRGGHRLPVVVVCAEGPIDVPRSRLEPVEHLLPGAPADALARAVRRLAHRLPPARLALRAGIADLDHARFAGRDGAMVRLSPREVDLLAYLAARPFQDVERDDLLQQVWGQPNPGLTKAVDMAVSRLRRKIEADPKQPEHLVATRGGGYRLVLPRTPRPRVPTRSVGREAELAQLADALKRGAPVVAVTGPPGIGKDRLVRVALGEVQAVTVDLGEVSDAPALQRALRTSLGLQGPSGDTDPTDHLHAALVHHAPVHLVLQGADRVLDAVAALAHGLPPGVSLWLTSRERPGLAGEVAVALGPLSRDAARALLCQRAEDVGVELPPGPDALDPLLDVLDGLPLAIELCAPSLRGRAVAELAQALATGRATLARRGGAPHDSLERALAGAWRWLSGDGRAHLAALSALPGPFDRALAAAVAGPSGEQALEGLVDTSWLWVEEGSFRLLGPVRRFVRRRADADDLARGRRALALEVARRARGIGATLNRSGLPHSELQTAHALLVAAWSELEPEAVADVALALDDVSGALGLQEGCGPLLEEALGRCPPDDVFRLQLGLGRALCSGPQATRGMAILAEAARSAGTEAQRAEARVGLAEALCLHGDYAEAEGAARQAQEVLAEGGDPVLRARAVAIGMVAAAFTRAGRSALDQVSELYGLLDGLVAAGEYRVAFRCQNRALVLLMTAGDTNGLRTGLDRLLGMAQHLTSPNDRITALWQQSNFAIRTRDFEGALPLLHTQRTDLLRRGLLVNAGIVSLDLARCHAELGDAVAAHAALDEVSRGSPQARGLALRVRGQLALEAGDAPGAVAWLERALEATGADRRAAALVRADLGLARWTAGDPDAARRLWAESASGVLPEAHRVHLAARRAALDPGHRDALAHHLAHVSDLEVDAYRDWLEGAALPTTPPAPQAVRLLAVTLLEGTSRAG